MRLLFTLDNKNYEGRSKIFTRIAVRAVIRVGDRLLMIKSSKYGEIKFIGGGVKNGETKIDALKREAKEEGGLILKDEFIPLGYAIEKRASDSNTEEIFYMESYYYLCEVKEFGKNELQDYEIDYDYKLITVDVESALRNNLGISNNPDIPWKERDTTFLKMLINNEIKI